MDRGRRKDGTIVPTDEELAAMSPEARFSIARWLASTAGGGKEDASVRERAERLLRTLEGTDLARPALMERRKLAATWLDADALAATMEPGSAIDDFAHAFFVAQLPEVERPGEDAARARSTMLRRAAELQVPGAASILLRSRPSDDDEGAARLDVARRAASGVPLPDAVARDLDALSSVGTEGAFRLASELIYAGSAFKVLLRDADAGREAPGAEEALPGLARAVRYAADVLSDAERDAWVSAAESDAWVSAAESDAWVSDVVERLSADFRHPAGLPRLRAQLPDACREVERDLVERWAKVIEGATLPDRGGAWGEPERPADAAAVAKLRRASELTLRLARDVSPGFVFPAARLVDRWARRTGDARDLPALLAQVEQLEDMATLQGWDEVAEGRVLRALADLDWCIDHGFPLDSFDAERILRGAEQQATDAVLRGDPRPAVATIEWAMQLPSRDHAASSLLDGLKERAPEVVSRLQHHLRQFDPEAGRLLAQLEDDPFAALVDDPDVAPLDAERGWAESHEDAAIARIPQTVNEEIEGRFLEWEEWSPAVGASEHASDGHAAQVSPFAAMAELIARRSTELAARDPEVGVALVRAWLREVNDVMATAEVSLDPMDQRAFEALHVQLADLALSHLEGVPDARSARATAWMVGVTDDALHWTLDHDGREPLDAQLGRIRRLRRHIGAWSAVLDEVLADTDAGWNTSLAAIAERPGLDLALDGALRSTLGDEAAWSVLSKVEDVLSEQSFQRMARTSPAVFKSFARDISAHSPEYPAAQRVLAQLAEGKLRVEAGELPADAAGSDGSSRFDPVKVGVLRHHLGDEVVEAVLRDAERAVTERYLGCSDALAVGAVEVFRARVERDAGASVVDRHLRRGSLQQHVTTLARRLLRDQRLHERAHVDAVPRALDPQSPLHRAAVAAAPELLEHLDWAQQAVEASAPRKTDDLMALAAQIAAVRGICRQAVGDIAGADEELRAAVRSQAASKGAVKSGRDAIDVSTLVTKGAAPFVDPASLWLAMLAQRGSLASEVAPAATIGRGAMAGGARHRSARRTSGTLSSDAGTVAPEAERGGGTRQGGLDATWSGGAGGTDGEDRGRGAVRRPKDPRRGPGPGQSF